MKVLYPLVTDVKACYDARMANGTGSVQEVFWEGNAAARIACPTSLVPAPGQYLLANLDSDQKEALPTVIFPAWTAEGGFLTASPFPKSWMPGSSLHLRGPMGNGFNLPASSRSVALASFDESHQRLGALIAPAIAQGAGIALLSSNPPYGLPEEVEIMPLNSLSSVLGWADYLALDISREMAGHLPEIVDISGFRGKAEALVTAPMPCGGRADCGVCAITLKRGYKLICKDGPVFDLDMLLR